MVSYSVFQFASVGYSSGLTFSPGLSFCCAAAALRSLMIVAITPESESTESTAAVIFADKVSATGESQIPSSPVFSVSTEPPEAGAQPRRLDCDVVAFDKMLLIAINFLLSTFPSSFSSLGEGEAPGEGAGVGVLIYVFRSSLGCDEDNRFVQAALQIRAQQRTTNYRSIDVCHSVCLQITLP